MYGSYGSYSSMSSITSPMDIAPRSHRAQDAACAFPSWPRTMSLTSHPGSGSGSAAHHDERPTSYLSDDDLFPCDPLSDDDTSSLSGVSTGSASPASAGSPAAQHQVVVSDAELLLQIEQENERLARQREYVRNVISEKERRRHSSSSSSSSSKKRRSSPGGAAKKASPPRKLSAIPEANEF